MHNAKKDQHNIGYVVTSIIMPVVEGLALSSMVGCGFAFSIKGFSTSTFTFFLGTSLLDREVALQHLVVTFILLCFTTSYCVSCWFLFSSFPRCLGLDGDNLGRKTRSLWRLDSSFIYPTIVNSGKGPAYFIMKLPCTSFPFDSMASYHSSQCSPNSSSNVYL